jgi:tetratricopeptide (TPR) repeat protein
VPGLVEERAGLADGVANRGPANAEEAGQHLHRAALAARQRLAPLLPGIADPFLHAASQLVMAWALPITGDVDGALREVAASLQELRGQDEPVFTAIAAFGAGSLETALGRHEDASRHLREARDLAQRFGGDWLTAGCQAELGILAVRQHLGAGQFDQAFTAGSALTQRDAVAIIQNKRDTGTQTS